MPRFVILLSVDALAALIEDIHDQLDGPPVRVILLDNDDRNLSYYSAVLRHAGAAGNRRGFPDQVEKRGLFSVALNLRYAAFKALNSIYVCSSGGSNKERYHNDAS